SVTRMQNARKMWLKPSIRAIKSLPCNMRQIYPFILLLMLLGCKKIAVAEADLQYLNGYWEIAEVEFPDGSKKQYTVNPSVDFIKLNDGEGFRKKMQPKFDGTYNTTN